MRPRCGRATPWFWLHFSLATAVLAVAAGQQTPATASTLSLQQLAALCSEYGDVLATTDLTQAARVCLDPTLSSTVLCPACQCHLQAALQPIAALTQLVTRTNASTLPPPPAPTTLLQACMPTIARLWSQLYPPTQLANATSALRKCTWGGVLSPGQCGAQTVAVDITLGESEDAPASEPYALAAGGVTWGALCACGAPKAGTNGPLCDPLTLQEYESECHAKCMGMTNTTTLVPCASLFTPTPTNTTLRIPSTPTTPLITASSGTPQAANTTTTPTTDTASTTANNMTANSTTAGVAAGSGTSGNISVVESVSGVSVGVHGTLAYYEYDYDVQECDTSGQCPVVGVGEGGVVVTEAAGGDVRRGVQQAVARAISQFTRPPDNTPTTTNQPRMPSLRSGAAVTVSSTATGSVASPTLQRKCSNTTVTLLRTLGPVLPAYMIDCDVARCFLTTLTLAIAPAPTNTTTTTPPTDPTPLSNCLPQLAYVLFQSGGASAVEWVRTCAGAKQPASAASLQACSGVLPVAQLRAAIASVRASVLTAPPPSTVPLVAALSEPLSGQTSTVSRNMTASNATTAMSQAAAAAAGPAATPAPAAAATAVAVTAGPAAPALVATAAGAALARWLQLIRGPAAATPASSPGAAATQPAYLTALNPSVILPESALWAFTAPPVGVNLTRSVAGIPTTWPQMAGSAKNSSGAATASGQPATPLLARAAVGMQQSGGVGQGVGGNGTSVGVGDSGGWVQWQSACACEQEYAPTCRSSDLTWYPSPCYAKCQGVSASELGPCYFTDDNNTTGGMNSGSSDDYYYSYYY